MTATQTSAGIGAGGSSPVPAEHHLSAAVHHPDVDGNRCRNCNARLADADIWCEMAAAR